MSTKFKLVKYGNSHTFIYLLFCLISGANKHLNMMLLREMLSKEHNLNIPTKCIWYFLDSYWDIEAAVCNKHCPLLFKFINVIKCENFSIFNNLNIFRMK